MGINVSGYDFSGWATKNDLLCSDGVIIRKGAFRIPKGGKKVPLMWMHQHDDPSKVLGHAILEEREEGIFAYGFFNSTDQAKNAKESLSHGDVDCLSIHAGNVDRVGRDILHGVIREVSIVLAGANPGAYVESVMTHGVPMDEEDDEAVIYTGEGIILSHADSPDSKKDKKEDGEDDQKKNSESEDNKTVGEVMNTLNDEQKEAVGIMIGQIMANNAPKNEDEDEEEEEVKHSVFEGGPDSQGNGTTLTHAEMDLIFTNAKRIGSLREAVHQYEEQNNIELMHAIPTTGMTVATGTQKYGFNDPEMLFPEFKSLNTPPEWISRNMEWVDKVLNGVHRSPFSRIKSMYADITEDEARAKGYIKGKQKKEEVFTTLKRTTSPQTVYKLQKMDRDDILDITDFDVVVWIRAEMRVMLNEELARAFLIGDGRPADDEHKISEEHIRPIAKDVPLFNTTVVVEVPTNASSNDLADALVDGIIRAKKKYKGSGTPTFWANEDYITDILLQKDTIGHRMYKTEQELSTTLRVKEIVPVEVMEGQTISVDGEDLDLVGVIVNLNDYNVGADKGGEISTFEDFDIDYNQHKYLIETRCSGALVKPFSALTIVIKRTASASTRSAQSSYSAE